MAAAGGVGDHQVVVGHAADQVLVQLPETDILVGRRAVWVTQGEEEEDEEEEGGRVMWCY